MTAVLPPLPDPDVLVEGGTASHRRLEATMDGLTDEMVRQPSLLPAWSVGHVLTHLARNADSHVRVLEGAIAGERRLQYPGGTDQRRGDIEAGSGRSADGLVADLLAASKRLEATWAAMTDEAWQGGGNRYGMPWPSPEVVFHRWREVEVHHTDLGLGYTRADWPDGYVAVELPRQLAVMHDRLSPTHRRDLVAWIMGRDDLPSLDLQPGEPHSFGI